MKGGKQNGPGCDIPLQTRVHFANCIAVSGQILKTTPEFSKSIGTQFVDPPSGLFF
jgi:hypothetical protein